MASKSFSPCDGCLRTRIGIALWLEINFIPSNQRRAEIELRPAIPVAIRGDSLAIKEWVDGLAILMSPDFKFTNEWGCEICGTFIACIEMDLSYDWVLLYRQTGEGKQVQRRLLDAPSTTQGRVLRT